MLVALLSTLEPTADDPATPRGFLRVGGRSVVQHQLGVALALGCERVICLAEGLPGELIALQHAAERSGVDFHAVANGRGLVRLVASSDRLLVLADGLIAAPAAAVTLARRETVIVQPVESGIAAGFERIDLNHASAGLIVLPGRLVAGLADLPGDWNPVSALLRLAVQAGLRQSVLPQALVDGGRWVLVRSEAEAHALEPRWLRLHTAAAAAKGPGNWLAARLVERFGPALLHAGTRPSLVAVGAAVLGLFGLGLSWIGVPAIGFGLLGGAWLVRRAAALLERIDRETVQAQPGWLRREAIFGWLLDGALVLSAVWRFADEHERATAIFVALVGIGLLRLIAAVFRQRRWAPWFEDRLIAGLALALASLTEVFEPSLMAAGLLLLAFALAAAARAPDPPAPSASDPDTARLTPP